MCNILMSFLLLQGVSYLNLSLKSTPIKVKVSDCQKICRASHKRTTLCIGLFFKRKKASARASSDRFFVFSLFLIKSLIKSNYPKSTFRHLFRTPQPYITKNSLRIHKEFPKNSQKIP